MLRLRTGGGEPAEMEYVRILHLAASTMEADVDVIVLDDLGYVQPSADDAEVLFTLMAERYERRSLVVRSNLVCSKWDRIFGNPMATAAAIDRVVHHSVIREFDVPSKRAEDAANAAASDQPEPATDEHA
jgi:DNA replication protein DnaC